MTVGDRIRELRTHFKPKMSQRQFGENIGVSLDVIGNLEYNRVEASEAMIRLICKTYKVNYDWLKNGVGEMMVPESVTEEELFGDIMDGEDEFMKSILRMVIHMSPDDKKALRQLVDKLKKLEE